MTAPKDLERRVCQALGGRRAGPVGAAVSDCVGTPFATEVKRTARPGLRQAWLAQARRQAKREGRPWLLVIAGHNDRQPVAVLDFHTLVHLADRAGLLQPGARLEPGPDQLDLLGDAQ